MFVKNDEKNTDLTFESEQSLKVVYNAAAKDQLN